MSQAHQLSRPLPASDEPLLTPDQVAQRLSVCRATLYAWIKSGKFGKPIKLSERRVAFRPQTVRDFIAAREQEAAQ